MPGLHTLAQHCSPCIPVMVQSTSSGSSQSLHSQSIIDLVLIQSVAPSITCKAKAMWGDEHVKEMLNLLIDKLPEMGDGDFKMQIWNQVVDHSSSMSSSYLATTPHSNTTGNSSTDHGKHKAESAISNISSSNHSCPQSVTAQHSWPAVLQCRALL